MASKEVVQVTMARCQEAFRGDGTCRFNNEDCCNPSLSCCEVTQICSLTQDWSIGLEYGLFWPIFLISITRRLHKIIASIYSEDPENNIKTMSLRNKMKMYWSIVSIFVISFIDIMIKTDGAWIFILVYSMFATMYWCYAGCIYWCLAYEPYNADCSKPAWYSISGSCLSALYVSIPSALYLGKTILEFTFCGINVDIPSFAFSLIYISSIILNDFEGILFWIIEEKHGFKMYRKCDNCTKRISRSGDKDAVALL
eukprot:329526_1